MITNTIKLDYKRKYSELYSPPIAKVQELVIPEFQFAMIDGAGAPEGSEEFQAAIGALYSVSYTLKFIRKKAGIGPDYSIAPLEGLWWMAGGSNFDTTRPADWRWTLMIMQPEFIGTDMFSEAIDELRLKKPSDALDKLRLEKFDESKVIQIMHIGPYDKEGPTLQLLDDYAAAHNYLQNGKHHEIYLGDPRRATPDKLRTILRRPITT